MSEHKSKMYSLRNSLVCVKIFNNQRVEACPSSDLYRCLLTSLIQPIDRLGSDRNAFCVEQGSEFACLAFEGNLIPIILYYPEQNIIIVV